MGDIDCRKLQIQSEVFNFDTIVISSQTRSFVHWICLQPQCLNQQCGLDAGLAIVGNREVHCLVDYQE